MIGAVICSLTASAQVVFADENGNEYANDATVTITEASYNDFDEFQMSLGNVYLKNTKGSSLAFNMTVNVTDLPANSNGFSCCFGSQCQNIQQAGIIYLNNCVFDVEEYGLSTSLHLIEWFPKVGQYGQCKAVISLSTGRTLNVIFDYAETNAVQGVATAKRVATICDAAGKRVNGLQKGLNIVRYSDGSIKKVMR